MAKVRAVQSAETKTVTETKKDDLSGALAKIEELLVKKKV